MKSILDPSFSYTSSLQTDLRKTFARIRREQRKREALDPSALGERNGNVLALQRPPAGLPDAQSRATQENGRVQLQA